MASFDFDALGTHWWIELIGVPAVPRALARLIKAEVGEFEERYSRFKIDSLVSKLNDQKTLINPPAELVDMLRYALKMHTATSGVFNISIGAKLEQLGYGRTPDNHAKISNNLKKSLVVTDEKLTLDQLSRIDLGGFGKGWLVDKLGALLHSQGFNNFVVNGGGDICVSAVSKQTVYVEHPFDPGLSIGEVYITSGGVAASSAGKRKWESGGHEYHHIIHPVDAVPMSSLASVHVLANNALLADTLGTVFLLVDEQRRAALADKFKVSYLAVAYDLSYFQSANFPGKMY